MGVGVGGGGDVGCDGACVGCGGGCVGTAVGCGVAVYVGWGVYVGVDVKPSSGAAVAGRSAEKAQPATIQATATNPIRAAFFQCFFNIVFLPKDTTLE